MTWPWKTSHVLHNTYKSWQVRSKVQGAMTVQSSSGIECVREYQKAASFDGDDAQKKKEEERL